MFFAPIGSRNFFSFLLSSQADSDFSRLPSQLVHMFLVTETSQHHQNIQRDTSVDKDRALKFFEKYIGALYPLGTMAGRDKAHKQRDRASQNKAGTYGNNEGETAAALQESNIETQFQNQIQSQLQNQLQNELSHTFENHEEADGHSTANVNILDSTNIDDELRNLEQLDINNIAKSAVAAAAVSFAQAATADDINHAIEGGDAENDVEGAEEEEVAAKTEINEGDDRGMTDEDEVIKEVVKEQGVELSADGNQDDDDADMKTPSSTDFSLLLKGLVFSLPVFSEENDHLKTMITSLGGEVVDDGNLDALALVPSKEKSRTDLAYQYLYQYIHDTFSKKTPLDINKYRVGKSSGQSLNINIGEFPIKPVQDEKLNENGDGIDANPFDFVSGDSNALDSKPSSKKKVTKKHDPTKAKKKSNKFTKEEDDFILDLVRRNPHLRSTHTFFARIAQLKPLSEHTGNSIRYRYRKVLAPNLAFVYKIDPKTGKPEIDAATNQPKKIEDIPSLIKSQYTSEEDYALCKHILLYKNGEMVLSGKKKHEVSQIPEAVFQELHKLNPRHSTMSWRDRYRKFAAKFGLRKYIAYYEECQQRDIEPEPMKNMSSRNDRKDYKVDVFGNESEERPSKRVKHEEDKILAKAKTVEDGKTFEGSDQLTESDTAYMALSKAKGKLGTETFADGSLSETSAAEGALEALANVSAEQTKANEISSNDSANVQDNLKTDETEATDTKTLSAGKKSNARSSKAVDGVSYKVSQTVESVSNDDGANLFAAATEDEMKQYDIALADSQLEESNTNTDKKDAAEIMSEHVSPEISESTAAHLGEEGDNDLELVDVKADDGLMDFRQLIDIDPEPLKHRGEIDLSTMISNIRECFRNFGDGNTPYELFKDISDQTGISMLWLNYWFDCSCGMLGTFIQAIINYLKTGDLVMNDVSGFWTEKDDELLKVDPENKDLLHLHGKDSVTKRKAVLFRYV